MDSATDPAEDDTCKIVPKFPLPVRERDDSFVPWFEEHVDQLNSVLSATGFYYFSFTPLPHNPHSLQPKNEE